MKSFLAEGINPLDMVHRASSTVPLREVRLWQPISNPGKVICVATNFHEPSRAGKPVPEYPIFFTRSAESFVGHAEPLLKHAVSNSYDFEGEFAVIIGRPGYKIDQAKALNHVAGYSCLNDGSVRDWQKHSTQVTPGKNLFKSGNFGPWLVTSDEIPDPQELSLQTPVNGSVKQKISMDRMLFDISWLISYFSTFTPLAAGDVIAAGRPSGFGSTRTPPEFLSDQDVVEVEITKIGTLRNVVRQE